MEKDIILEKIVDHNIKRLQLVDFDVKKGLSKKLELFLIEDVKTGGYVHNFFLDNKNNPVDPYEVYDGNKLNKLIKEWVNRKG